MSVSESQGSKWTLAVASPETEATIDDATSRSLTFLVLAARRRIANHHAQGCVDDCPVFEGAVQVLDGVVQPGEAHAPRAQVP